MGATLLTDTLKAELLLHAEVCIPSQVHPSSSSMQTYSKTFHNILCFIFYHKCEKNILDY